MPVNLPSALFLPHTCASCGASFLAEELLGRHSLFGCKKRALREDTPPSTPTTNIPHSKRVKVSQTVYLPIGPRLKQPTDGVAVRKKVVFSNVLPTSQRRVVVGAVSQASTAALRTMNSFDNVICPSEVDSTPSGPSDKLGSISLASATLPQPNEDAHNRNAEEASADPAPSEIRAGPPANHSTAVRRSARLNPQTGNDSVPVPLTIHKPRVHDADTRLSKYRALRDARLPKPTYFEGPTNSFDLRRRYYSTSLPIHDPEEHITLQDLHDPSTLLVGSELLTQPASLYGPFPNLHSLQLGEWYLGAGSQLSMAGLQRLIKMLQSPGFSESISRINWPKVLDKLSDCEEDLGTRSGGANGWSDDDGWKSSPISINVPLGKATCMHAVGTLYHRSIVSVVQQKILNCPDQRFFHYDPYEITWQPDPTSKPERVYAELYNSDAFLKAHRELQDSAPILGCNRPRVVVGLMFWSDETHLASFSSEKLWPLYMLFGNESKYRRCRPTSDCCHHVAYFDKLSGTFKDFVTEKTGGKIPSKAFMTHCKGEMFHEQWNIMLDDELLEAMEDGIVIMCQDGIERRFFIRIFTYSADYPEKCLIATTRPNGDHPCPRCLVAKRDVHLLGTSEDMRTRRAARKDNEVRQALVLVARQRIYEDKVVVANKGVGQMLKPQSLHPIMSAFSSRLSTQRFNIFSALTVDVLHEFEIGVWKALFIHLLRIICASMRGGHLIHELDKRYRQVPAFGKAIRRFSGNVSEMKKKAARDYEDLLQCAIPAFESIVPNAEHSKAITSLLSICARWHALAKLRMHTDSTLRLLDVATVSLGEQFRAFVNNVCSKVKTTELESEALAREVREQRKLAKAAKEASTLPEGTKSVNTRKKPRKRNPKQGQSRASGLQDRVPIEPTPVTNPPAKRGRGRPRKNNVGSENEPASVKGTGLSDASEPAAQSTSGTSPTLRAATAKGTNKGKRRAALPSTADSPPDSMMLPHTPLANPSDSPANSGEAPSTEAAAETPPPPPPDPLPTPKTSRKRVTLNINIPKFHFLGDYTDMIRAFGTTDSYSTELGELMHRFPKRWFRRSSKKNTRKGVLKQERQSARIKDIRKTLNIKRRTRNDIIQEQEALASRPDVHHFIGMTQNWPIPLATFSSSTPVPSGISGLADNQDPVAKTFISRLQEHLLPRIVSHIRKARKYAAERGETLCPMFDNDSAFDPSFVSLKDNRVFAHKTMRVKFTTYDLRRREDTLHIDSDVCNIMIPNPQRLQDSHAPPYLYARLLGIYHGSVSYTGEIAPGIRHLDHIRMEFLLVRWYTSINAVDSESLERISFPPISSPFSTTFLNPDAVLRAAHVIPRMYFGKNQVCSQGVSEMAKDGEDWREYYVNRYADRDIFMRYEIGMSIGHKNIWSQNAPFMTLQGEIPPLNTALHGRSSNDGHHRRMTKAEKTKGGGNNEEGDDEEGGYEGEQGDDEEERDDNDDDDDEGDEDESEGCVTDGSDSSDGSVDDMRMDIDINDSDLDNDVDEDMLD